MFLIWKNQANSEQLLKLFLVLLTNPANISNGLILKNKQFFQISQMILQQLNGREIGQPAAGHIYIFCLCLELKN